MGFSAASNNPILINNLQICNLKEIIARVQLGGRITDGCPEETLFHIDGCLLLRVKEGTAGLAHRI